MDILYMHYTITICRLYYNTALTHTTLLCFTIIQRHFIKKNMDLIAGLPNDCPSLPPIYQVFCGNPRDSHDCILSTWVCDGNIDCRVTGLDESAATCQNGMC